MSYQVIARKWRPQNFDEVVFQDHVSTTLQNSIKNNRISHAYLFSGPRGVGKTTMARILSKALNCINGPTSKPCGKCDNCREIKNGISFDVIEIDGASNRGIDDIKQLRENVNFAPAKAIYKIYIIDEIHMLTKEAFNALLKTLEEPPPHIVFIFATTEIHQIPETILSRCQKFFFKKIPVEPIVEHLKYIIDKEGYKISDNALYPIARAAAGSMRDAQSLMEQVISFSGSSHDGDELSDMEIGEDDALAILGVVPVESYVKQLTCISELDSIAVMNEVDRVLTMGVDIPRYAAGFADILRSLRLIKNGISLQALLGLSEEEVNLLNGIENRFYDEELSLIFRIVNDLLNDLRFANSQRVNLEMAFLDMISAKKSPSISSILEKINNTSPDMNVRQKDDEREDKVNYPDEIKEQQEIIPESNELNNKPVSIDERGLYQHWVDFLASIINEYLHVILKSAKIGLENNTLYIKYPPGEDHSYYISLLDTKKLSIIKNEMSKRLEHNINVAVGVSDSDVTQPVQDNGKKQNEVLPDSSENNMAPSPDAVMLNRPDFEEFEKMDPTVEKIKNIFNGKIIKKGE